MKKAVDEKLLKESYEIAFIKEKWIIKKAYTIIIVTFLLVSSIIIILFINSYSIALFRAGIKPENLSSIHTYVESNGREYRILLNKDANKNITFVQMVKKPIGLWSVEYSMDTMSSKTGLATYGWMRPAGVKSFSMVNPVFEYEVHQIYYGQNAIKLIEISQEQLPDNVTVHIQQAGPEYTIHFMAYGDADILSKIGVYNLLVSTGCIKK